MNQPWLKGSSIIQAFKESGVRTVVALPDIVTCDSVLWPISRDADFKLVPVCKEDEGVSICAGLSYCDHRAVLLIQHTGFLDSINAIRSIAVEYQLPIVMFVGLQGMEPDKQPDESASIGIRMLHPICESMGLEAHNLNYDMDTESVVSRINAAYEQSHPIVFFIQRSPELDEAL